MYKKLLRKLMGIFFLMLSVTTISESRIKVAENIYLDAFFRPRTELEAMDFNAATGFDAYSTFRTRLGIGLENLVENTTLYLNLADSRTMGYNDPYLQGTPVAPNKSDQNLGVDIAYIETRNFLFNGTMLRIGRMENNQGRERLFGPGNWSVFGPRTYDGMKIGYDSEKLSGHFWTLYGRYGDRHWYFGPGGNPEEIPYEETDYKRDHTLNGLDLGLEPKLLLGSVDLMLYLDLNQAEVLDTVHQEKNVDWSRWTMAGYYCHKTEGKSGFNLEADAAYQFGNQALGTGNADISAYMVFLDLAYKFDLPMKPTAGLGLDYTSGDNGLHPMEINNFYEYYYSAHTFQGHMDLFSGTEPIKNYGLQDFILRLGCSPLKSLKCKIDIHYFKTEFGYPSEVDDEKAKELGWETDITTDWEMRKGLKLRLGYDFFLPSEDWQGEGADVGTFIYTELTASI